MGRRHAGGRDQRVPRWAKLTERFRRIDYGHLEIDFTLDDPKAFTWPWSTKLNQFIVLGTELLDYICAENERDVSHLVGK